ncbi:TIGR04283 family arsenosugar biosynthesis glycosyltransferase [bacterium]|nr:TIGR04283 family arsenosugar biosynthesis glycosyltransferase [bacterium]MCI0603436.1 TIGR04283 family arsenosugar biosynthesis glycosyltransferase [bacterium]
MNGISVIIPTLNERTYLPETLKNLHHQDPPADEILVVDGGSEDGTQEIAEKSGALLICSEKSISQQMNLGASRSHGDLLVFLHADCILDEKAFVDLLHCMKETEVVGGAFQLELRGNRPLLDRYLSWSGSWNARRSQIYLGDHGIFCRRSVFLEAGGFPDVTLMYEFELMRKLRLRGKLVQLNKKCYASARRFQRYGYWKTILLMRSLRAFYRLGLPINRLEQIYREQAPHREYNV